MKYIQLLLLLFFWYSMHASQAVLINYSAPAENKQTCFVAPPDIKELPFFSAALCKEEEASTEENLADSAATLISTRLNELATKPLPNNAQTIKRILAATGKLAFDPKVSVGWFFLAQKKPTAYLYCQGNVQASLFNKKGTCTYQSATLNEIQEAPIQKDDVIFIYTTDFSPLVALYAPGFIRKFNRSPSDLENIYLIQFMKFLQTKKIDIPKGSMLCAKIEE